MDDHQASSVSPMSHLVQTTLSYNTNVMLAAIISLLLVILFVLLLHLYAKWFLSHTGHRSRHSVNVTLPRHLLPPSHHRRFTIIDATTSPSEGLHPSAIASIPLFVFTSQHPQADDHHLEAQARPHHQQQLECAICLSAFEEDEVGRKLPECGHAFHVECIDMWLRSHSTCPICRAGIYIQHRTSSSSTYKTSNNYNEELQGGGGTGELIVSPGNRDHEESPTDHDVVPPVTMENVTIENLEDQSVINNICLGNINDDLESGCQSSSSSLGGSLMRLLSSSSRSGGKIHPSIHNVGG